MSKLKIHKLNAATGWILCGIMPGWMASEFWRKVTCKKCLAKRKP